MTYELKIKSKHLAEEARIIRFEEKKNKKLAKKAREHQNHERSETLLRTARSLHNHRVWDVRKEARATNLARAYLAGVPYASVEQKRVESKEWDFQSNVVPRIAKMASKYGSREVSREEVRSWLNA